MESVRVDKFVLGSCTPKLLPSNETPVVKLNASKRLMYTSPPKVYPSLDFSVTAGLPLVEVILGDVEPTPSWKSM